jgi:uncharacterized membrane protein YbjE (DUF340 family)
MYLTGTEQHIAVMRCAYWTTLRKLKHRMLYAIAKGVKSISFQFEATVKSKLKLMLVSSNIFKIKHFNSIERILQYRIIKWRLSIKKKKYVHHISLKESCIRNTNSVV